MQTNSPILSVLMPVYNGEKFLNSAIKSILNQSFTHFELIIINDGSTDGTEKIINSYKDDRIVYVKNDFNLRLIKTLNKGLELARGTYIARMDADDISLPDRFERQIAVFKEKPEVDIVNANAFHLEEDGKRYRKQRFSTILSAEAIKYLIPIQNFICHPVVMVKSDLLKRYRYKDELEVEHIEDFDLWNRMLADNYKCYSIDKPLLYYRDNSSSINHTQGNKQVDRMQHLSNHFLNTRFEISIDENLLKSILNFGLKPNSDLIKKIDDQLAKYNQVIKNNFNISTAGYQEMELWRKKKILYLIIKSIVGNRFEQKVSSFVFLASKIYWFTNPALIRFTINALSPHYYKLDLN